MVSINDYISSRISMCRGRLQLKRNVKFLFGVYSAVRVRSVSILRFAFNGTQGISIDQDSIHIGYFIYLVDVHNQVYNAHIILNILWLFGRRCNLISFWPSKRSLQHLQLVVLLEMHCLSTIYYWHIDKEVNKNVKNILLSICDVKVFFTFTWLNLVLLWQLFYLFCSSIVINTT
jgi:hypothetical protein